MFLKKHPAVLLGAVFLALALPVTAWAQSGSPDQGMSLDQAIQSAQQYNIGLKSAQFGVNAANNSLISSISTGNFITQGIGQQNAYANLTYTRNTTIYQTEEDYFGVQDAVYNEQIAEKSVAEAQLAYDMAQAQKQAGVYTDTQVSAAKSTLDLQQSLLTENQAKVDAAYVSFNTITGANTTDRSNLTTQVTDDPSYNIGVADADQAVADTLNNYYPAIVAKNTWLGQQNSLDSTDPLTNVYNTSQQDQLAEEATLQSLEAGARSAYLAIGTVQDAYNSVVKAQIAAQSAYSDAQANYNAGVSTKDDLLQAELKLLSANQGLQADLHALLLAEANLAVMTRDGSVNIPASEQQ